jgi:hypothetical protein
MRTRPGEMKPQKLTTESTEERFRNKIGKKLTLSSKGFKKFEFFLSVFFVVNS